MKTIAWLFLSLLPATAFADILLLDVNDQPGERKAVTELAKEFGEEPRLVVGWKTKDFLATLEMELARAERGEANLETIVFSGHSYTGRDFFSEDKDRQIMISDLQALSSKYPKAFSQVRHVMLMGCLAGAKDDIAEWSRMFPNVTMAAGFNGKGPSGKAAERFLKQVLREVERREAEAGGADAFAEALERDQDAIDGWSKTLASLEGVRVTKWGFELCGSFYTRDKADETTRGKIERLMNDAFFACRDAERACRDPNRKKGDLNALYLMNEEHVRPHHPNPTAFDHQQRKLQRLRHYDDLFMPEWLAKNGPRLDAASRNSSLPDAAGFARMTRGEQLDAIREFRTNDASRNEALGALADDLQWEIVELRDAKGGSR